MNPCTGIGQFCPPLCTYKELKDGTYSIADVLKFNLILKDILDKNKGSDNG